MAASPLVHISTGRRHRQSCRRVSLFARGIADSTFSAADSTEIPPTFMRKSREPIPPDGRREASGTYSFFGVCQIFNPPHNKSFSRILDTPLWDISSASPHFFGECWCNFDSTARKMRGIRLALVQTPRINLSYRM